MQDQDKIAILRTPRRFIEDVLGYHVAPHHARIFRHVRMHDRTIDLAPRGFGKSTIGDVAYCIWRIVQDRNIRILVVSNTQRQAEAFIREIKSQMIGNEKLISMYGEFIGEFKKWTESEVIVNGRKSVQKESTLTGLGASGQVISKHFDIIIGDDIVDFENARTELQREKLIEWYYSSLMPTLEPNGEIHLIGTRYHPFDLYQTLIDYGGYSIQVQQAITDGKSLWPDKFSLELLEQKRQESGSLIFNMQYQNNAELARQGHIFKYTWMQWYDVIPINLRIFQGVDLAISMAETADYFVICTIGMDAENKIYVLDMVRSRLSFKEQMEMIKKKGKEWSPIRIGIESNTYQKVLGQELIRTTDLPIRQITTLKDKVTRAQRRSAEFENGKVFLKKDMHIFVDELVLFPDSSHDDTFDAYDFARQVSKDEIKYVPPQFGSGIGYGGV